MIRCVQCGRLFDPPFEKAVLCSECCHLEDHEICFEALSLGEGSVECDMARKDHLPPHIWIGTIGDCVVEIRWTKNGGEKTSS